MILSSGSAAAGDVALWWSAALAAALYAGASVRGGQLERWARVAFPLAWVAHWVVLAVEVLGWGSQQQGARLGFAPVLSLTVWIVIGVHAVESRFVPLPAVRGWLAPVGAMVVLLAAWFPGDVRGFATSAGPLHFILGVGAYGLFGAAVVHAALLDASETRLRRMRPDAKAGPVMPLLQLERLTFRFVEVGFAVLSAALALGIATASSWRWDHKNLLSILGWTVFAALLAGRRLRGWRGRRATRWLYAGALLLLLAYVGSRFVLEVVLPRSRG